MQLTLICDRPSPVPKCSKLRLGRCAKDKKGQRINATKKLVAKALDTGHILVIPQQKSNEIK